MTEIEFFSRNDFVLNYLNVYKKWVEAIIFSEHKRCGAITYTFCDDAYLDELNQAYLNHKDLTDILSFDYTEGTIISGDIVISTERVAENAANLKLEFNQELLRVMAHGILHYCGYTDKTTGDKAIMRQKEDEKMAMFHVEQF